MPCAVSDDEDRYWEAQEGIAYVDYVLGRSTGKTEKPEVVLCDILKGLSTADLDRVLYNGRDRRSRRLADWWEDHQERDKRRGN